MLALFGGRAMAEGDLKHIAACDYSAGKVMIIEEGKVIWEHPAPESNDLWILPNGNLLFTTGKGVLEMTLRKDTVFSFRSESSIFACQRLENGNTFIGECTGGRLLEVAPSGQILKSISILPEGGTADHAFMRNARKLPNGHYLVAHYGSEEVSEYDCNGKRVWNIKVPGGPHSVIRLPEGDTFVAVADKTGNPRIVRLSPDGTVKWEFSNADLPGNPLKFLGGMHYFPDGRLAFANWVGHENPDNPVHIFVVNPDKEVVDQFGRSEDVRTISSVYVLSEKEKGAH